MVRAAHESRLMRGRSKNTLPRPHAANGTSQMPGSQLSAAKQVKPVTQCSTDFQLPGTNARLPAQKQGNYFFELSLAMWYRFFLFWPRNQAQELSVEVSNIADESKSCWSRSSRWEESSIVSSCYRARRSISESTKRSWGLCFAQRARKDLSWGRKNRGCFTGTMYPLRTPWATGSSWPRGRSPYRNNLLIHLILLLMTFLFPKFKGIFKGTRFKVIKRDVKGISEESFWKRLEAWQRRIEKGIPWRGN